MSVYQGRTGPMVSQYTKPGFDSLNVIGGDDQFLDANDYEADLARWTNTTFATEEDNTMIDDSVFGNVALDNTQLDLQSFGQPDTTHHFSIPGFELPSQDQSQNYNTAYGQAIQPGPPPADYYASTIASPAQPTPTAANRSSESQDDKAKTLAEEDKRRRNTAASARFRVKKKQKEEKMSEDLKLAANEKAKLVKENESLRTENKFLRDLITSQKISQDDLEAYIGRRRKESEECELKAEKADA